ncbi:MAG: GTP-binding protein, partial [Flavobacteriales bacterium]|nr:GTP-binding protein [Flavobacteriales bacterium]
HLQYTRNMVTGASTANLALILVDVRRGVQEQTRRHAFIASLLGIRHMVFCVNKMDLEGFAEDRFNAVRNELGDFAGRLEVPDIHFVPISAQLGDMVVERGTNMPWYQGPTLMHLLENVHIGGDIDRIRRRFPVQTVVRHVGPDGPRRAILGRVAGGVVRVGDPVLVLPGGRESTVQRIFVGLGEVDECFAPQSAAIELADEIDVARGDMITGVVHPPTLTQDLEVMVCWSNDRPLRAGDRLLLRQSTAATPCLVKEVVYTMDINTLRKDERNTTIPANGIGRVRLRTATPVAVDSYARNRTTGSLILIDEATNATAGAGMVV